jgi:hypothetical protein
MEKTLYQEKYQYAAFMDTTACLILLKVIVFLMCYSLIAFR